MYSDRDLCSLNNEAYWEDSVARGFNYIGTNCVDEPETITDTRIYSPSPLYVIPSFANTRQWGTWDDPMTSMTAAASRVSAGVIISAFTGTYDIPSGAHGATRSRSGPAAVPQRSTDWPSHASSHIVMILKATIASGDIAMQCSLIALAALATALSPAASIAQVVYIRTVPTFDPNGSFNFPFGNLRSSLCGSFQTPADVRISPGTYFEAGKYTSPATLTALSGPVTISSAAQAVVPLRVMSYNVRLWPGFFVGQTLADNERAGFIGTRLASENADVIAMQESWDYRLDSVDASERNNALRGGVYNNQYYGGAFMQSTDNNNSGLLTQSIHALSGGQQFRFIECDGFDCQASKGWTRVTFTKSGIPITVFNTHAQAGDSTGNQTTREDQMIQMVQDIIIFRSLNPSHVIIAAGDFNVDRLGAEFASTFAPILRTSGMADAALNEQCSTQTSACTSCSFNTMKQLFGGTTNTLLDYIFYSAPANGSVEVVLINYVVRQYRRTDGGQWCRTVEPTGCTNEYSDHEPIVADFELRRVTP